MESNQNQENSRATEYTPLDSQALMNLATSQQNKLKERERLQVAVIEERIGKLAQDLQNRYENALSLIRHDFDLEKQRLAMIADEMRRDNQRLREELKQAQDNFKSFQQETYKAVKSDRKRIKALESRSLIDQFKDLFRK